MVEKGEGPPTRLRGSIESRCIQRKRITHEYGGGIGHWALDKEALDKESKVWKPAELQLWIGHGYRHRPRQIRNLPRSEASWARSLSNAPTVRNISFLKSARNSWIGAAPPAAPPALPLARSARQGRGANADLSNPRRPPKDHISC